MPSTTVSSTLRCPMPLSPPPESVPAVPILAAFLDPNSDLTPDERHTVDLFIQLVLRRVTAAGLL